MPLIREPHAEPVPGYRLIEPLGRGKYGEVWKCEAPGGLFKAVKFVYGNLNDSDADRAGVAQELSALERVKAIRHPFILSLERVEIIDGELLIVMELADESLHDRLLARQKSGLPGIPRRELLGYLREAAEALDLMNLNYNLQHLDIKPRNLFLVSNHIKVADFGLVNNLAIGDMEYEDVTGQSATGHAPLGTPLYTSPEAFRGQLSRFSDQYSLAIVFQELLTGALPFNGRNFRQLALQHLRAEPEVSALPSADRPILRRALAKEPEKRFPNCMAFVHALAGKREAVVEPPARSAPREARVGEWAATSAPRVLKARPVEEPEAARETPADEGTGQTAVAEPVFSPFDCLPGYQFLDCVGRSPLGEVWKVLDPTGRRRLVKFIHGFATGSALAREFRSAARLKGMSHPCLAPAEIVQSDPVRLVLLTDHIEQTLRDRFMECQAEGLGQPPGDRLGDRPAEPSGDRIGERLPGIPRQELLGYLRCAAEALDFLFQEHSLQHLGLNPRNLLLTEAGLQVADFGLVQLLWLPAGQPVAQLNARYSAPELFDNQISGRSDQYSLALIYQEMLTGHHPYRGQTGRVSPTARRKVKLDLDPLPGPDRVIIAQALDRDPQRRFATCVDLIRELERAKTSAVAGQASSTQTAADLAGETARAGERAEPGSSPAEHLQALVAAAQGPVQLLTEGRMRYWLYPDGSVLHRCGARVPGGVARHKLQGFRERWKVTVVEETENRFIYQMAEEPRFFRRGRQGVEIEINLYRARPLSATLCEVVTHVRRLSAARRGPMPAAVGPALLQSVFRCLQANLERRGQERFPFTSTVRLQPQANGQRGEFIEGTGKDVSATGMGLWLPVEPPPGRVRLYVDDGKHQHIGIPATIVRVQVCEDGTYEVGLRFEL